MKSFIKILIIIDVCFFIWCEWEASNRLDRSVAPSTSYKSSLAAVCKRLEVQPDWLLRTIQAESGGNSKAKNSYGHVGLIQFAPNTAKGLGYTTTEIANMSSAQQLKPIEAFYKPAIGRIKSYVDMRMYTFFPLALGKPDSFVLQAPGSPAALIAKRNPSFDLNNDKQITVAEFKAKIK